MDNREELIELYDIYKEMFTEIQKDTFEKYYFFDLSLSEIAEENNKSRASVSESINVVRKQLYEFESKIKVKEKYKLKGE